MLNHQRDMRKSRAAFADDTSWMGGWAGAHSGKALPFRLVMQK